MVDAIQYFKDRSKEKAKEAVVEIVELGLQSIDPNQKVLIV